MADVLFMPVCSDCHKILLCDIDYEEMPEPVTTSNLSNIYTKRYSITPYSCPFCGEIFTRIEMPAKLPYRNTANEISRGLIINA